METELNNKLEKIEQRLENIEKELIEQKLKLDGIYEVFNLGNFKRNGLGITGLYMTFILGNISGIFFFYSILKWLISLIKR